MATASAVKRQGVDNAGRITCGAVSLSTSTYAVHGVNVAVHGDSRTLRHFQSELGSFEAGEPGVAGLDVTVAPFSFQPQAGDRRIGRCLVSDDVLYGSGRHKVASWRFALVDPAGQNTALWFEGGPFSGMFLQSYFIQPLLGLKLAELGVALVHGGSVVRNGKAVLFAGVGHSGKTALAIHQTAAGWEFQADDHTALSADGETYAFPRRLHVSKQTLDACPSAWRELRLKNRLAVLSHQMAFALSLGYGDLPVSLPIDQVVPGSSVAPRARLQSVMVLSPVVSTVRPITRWLTSEQLLENLMFLWELETEPLLKHLRAFGYVTGRNVWSEYSSRMREVLRQATGGVQGLEVLVPGTGRNAVTQLASIMDGLLR